MKTSWIIIISVAIFLGFSSCKKCMKCSSTNKKTGKVIDVYPEICGKKASLDVQELTYRRNLPDTVNLECNRD